jgi:hypothetical protein
MNMKLKKVDGYTVTELIVLMLGLACLLLFLVVCGTGVHFVRKFW